MQHTPDPTTVEQVDVHPVFPWLTAPRRAWLYRVATATSLAAGGYGVVDSNKAALIVGVVAAFLGVGTATVHTPTATGG